MVFKAALTLPELIWAWALTKPSATFKRISVLRSMPFKFNPVGKPSFVDLADIAALVKDAIEAERLTWLPSKVIGMGNCGTIFAKLIAEVVTPALTKPELISP